MGKMSDLLIDSSTSEEIIKRLFAVVKELRFIYKQLFWREKKWTKIYLYGLI